MSSKSEVIAKINPTSTYIGTAVRTMINEVTCDASVIPQYLKKGDVIKLSAGLKPRPCCVIKVMKEYVVAIPLSSTENVHNLCESDSRFFGKGWFCNNFIVAPIELARENFIGTFDNMKCLNNAIKELRLFIVKSV